jgi:hypothetical protein
MSHNNHEQRRIRVGDRHFHEGSRLPVANLITGYSVKAMERKIERGDWSEGKVWKRAPDGHILIDMVGYQNWVENRQ